MAASFDVRFWKTQPLKGKRGNSYRVRWVVAGEVFSEVLRPATLAESFRSALIAAYPHVAGEIVSLTRE